MKFVFWSLCLLLFLIGMNGCSYKSIDGQESLSAQQIDSLKKEALELRNQGRDYRENGLYEEALNANVKALTISLRCNDTIGIVRDYNQLGTTFRRLGRMEQALNNHYLALGYAEAASYDTSAVARKNLVVSLNGLGNVHLTVGNTSAAERCFRRSLQGEESLESHLGMAINYANLGSIFESRNELDSARYYYEKSMEQNQIISSDRGIALCHIYFGNLYTKVDSLALAEKEYLKAAELMQTEQEMWHGIEPLLALGKNLYLQNRLDESAVYLDKAYELAVQMHSYEQLQEVSELKAELMERMGNMKEALSYYRMSKVWQDSLINPEHENAIRDICIKYEQNNTRREMQMLQTAYDANRKMQNMLSWIIVALLLSAFVTIGLMLYSLMIRKSKLQAMRRLQNLRDSFFRNITHEFRTPLTVILGLADQLTTEGLTEGQRAHFLKSIKQQGHSLLDLVNQLLALTKLMTGFDHCEWRRGDVVSLMRMCLSCYKDYADINHIQVRFSSSPSVIETNFVPEYYDRILRNLVGNAFKFTPSGGSIMVKATVKDGAMHLDVADTGVGIPEEDAPYIFDMFYQGKESSFTASTGIGLPYVREMVQQMGGTITALNNEPRGTIMHMVLPLNYKVQNVEIQPWTVSQQVEKCSALNESFSLAGIKTRSFESEDEEFVGDESLPLVLVVEDNADIADYITTLLVTRYRVIRAVDGYDALQKAASRLPNLIITDLMMPGMDGYQLCQSIRQSQILSDIPIIIVSARTEEADRIRGYEEGADGYLVKPFNPSELHALISRLLEQRLKGRQRMQQIASGVYDQLSDVLPEADRQDTTVFLQKLHAVIEKQMINGDLHLDTIAECMNLSRSTLVRSIKQITGCVPSAYILQVRLEQARQLLITSQLTIGEVALACGFDDMSYFSRVFKQNYNLSPTQYRNQNVTK